MKRVNVAICGFGRIGQQIAELLLNRSTYYKQKYQVDARLVGVCNSSSGLIDQDGLQASSAMRPNTQLPIGRIKKLAANTPQT